MKGILAVLLLAGIALGGAGVAWAQGAEGERGAKRQALRTCVREARQANPDSDKEALRPAVRSCLETKGITPPELTPEQREKREARRAKLRECVQQSKAANPDADRAAIRAAVRSCVKAG